MTKTNITSALAGTNTLAGWIDAFLLDRRAGNCTASTIDTYRIHLERFAGSVADVSALAAQRYLNGLRGRMKPISVHKHYRTLRAFFGWAVGVGVLSESPLKGFRMKLPRTMPRVPQDSDVRALLRACGDSWEGKRNRALVALLADGGLRISEALRLRIEDVRFNERTLRVLGKGQKEAPAHFGAESAAHLRSWLGVRNGGQPEDWLFCSQDGRPMRADWGTHLVHRLSVKAKLARKIGPHALRHYAAVSILKTTGDLELVRQVLRHETLTMALRYAHYAAPDVARKFRRASPLDNLRAGR